MKVRSCWKWTSQVKQVTVSLRISRELAALRASRRMDKQPVLRSRNMSSTDGNKEKSHLFSCRVRCVWTYLQRSISPFIQSLIFSQMNLVESLLLMRTSSSRSLALTCLYSLYSTANGERSSFCTFLWDEEGKTTNSKKVRSLSSGKPRLLFYNTNKFFFFLYLPFCLKNWSSNSFRFLRILFFSSLVSWSCSTSSCLCD